MILRITIPKLIIFGVVVFISLGIGIWVYNTKKAEKKIIVLTIDVWDCGDDTSNVTCALNSEGVLRISGTGAIKENAGEDGNPWRKIGVPTITLIIDEGVTSIGKHAFYHYGNLVSVTIANTVTAIGWGAFGNCKSLESITIPNGVTEIGGLAFVNCESLKSITFPDGVTEIMSSMFAFCTALTSAVVPSSVVRIEPSVFQGCTSLTSIEVAVDNLSYSSKGGVLFNKDETLLIIYPEGKRGAYVVPSSVKTIGLLNSVALTSVTIPNSVEYIYDSAFRTSAALTSVICLAPTPPEFLFLQDTNEISRRRFSAFRSTNICLYVPANSLEVYRTAKGYNRIWNWGTELDMKWTSIWTHFECIKPLEDAPKEG